MGIIGPDPDLRGRLVELEEHDCQAGIAYWQDGSPRWPSGQRRPLWWPPSDRRLGGRPEGSHRWPQGGLSGQRRLQGAALAAATAFRCRRMRN